MISKEGDGARFQLACHSRPLARPISIAWETVGVGDPRQQFCYQALAACIASERVTEVENKGTCLNPRDLSYFRGS